MTRVLYFRYTNRFVKGNIVAILPIYECLGIISSIFEISSSDFFHIQGAALVKPAIDLSNKVSCYASDIRRQRSRIVPSI